MKFETKAIRTQIDRSQHREHCSAIYTTSSFVFDNAEQMRAMFADEIPGNIYSRFTNPSVTEFEQKIAILENAEDAFAAATGMAAIYAAFVSFLISGDHIISTRAIFGSTFNIIQDTLPAMNISYDFVDGDKPEQWQLAYKPNSKIFYVETPSNPGLQVYDIQAMSRFCQHHDMLLIVDNCFATPYLQNPLDMGANLVIHSATKYIDGQGRVLGGVVAGENEYVEKVRNFIRRTGATLSPFNAWILSKSLETLAIRMDRHCSNALAVAKYLEHHIEVSSVTYPHLHSHPNYEIAIKQMRQGGGLVSFELKKGLDAGKILLNNTDMFSLTANLGDTRTIITHPASTTHYKMGETERLKAGISDGMIRLSLGLEHIEDIISELDQALALV